MKAERINVAKNKDKKGVPEPSVMGIVIGAASGALSMLMLTWLLWALGAFCGAFT